jgi:Zn-dependent alcohol dehydrogenase
MIKTQALVHPAVGRKASLEEVELDEVSGSEVLVRMVASG